MSITFTCTATGVPAPSLSFLRGSEALTRTGREDTIGETLTDRVQLGEEDIQSLPDGLSVVTRNLTLFSAEDRDSGNFTCMASADILGKTATVMVSFQLTVLGKNEQSYVTFMNPVVGMVK